MPRTASSISPDYLRKHGIEPGPKRSHRHGLLPDEGSDLEVELIRQMQLARVPFPEREMRLVPGRRFRADFAWPAQRLICEVEGGVWMKKARHTSGTGFTQDAEKYNLLTLSGWRVLRVTADHIRSGQALEWITRGLESRP